MNGDGGWTIPYMWILLVIVGVLVWQFGWIVLLYVAGLFVLITAGVWVHDLVTHDHKCRWCNVIKDAFEAERRIPRERIQTKHIRSHDTHMLVQVFVDGEKDVVIDIDFNGVILGTRAAEAE